MQIQVWVLEQAAAAGSAVSAAGTADDRIVFVRQTL